jgi:hypothetical protein
MSIPPLKVHYPTLKQAFDRDIHHPWKVGFPELFLFLYRSICLCYIKTPCIDIPQNLNGCLWDLNTNCLAENVEFVDLGHLINIEIIILHLVHQSIISFVDIQNLLLCHWVIPFPSLINEDRLKALFVCH